VVSESASNSDEISAEERRRRDAVWELFTSECVFLLDHLMALKHVSRTISLYFFLVNIGLIEKKLSFPFKKPVRVLEILMLLTLIKNVRFSQHFRCLFAYLLTYT